MTNRKLLYGYKIQDGGLSVVMEEAAVVSRVYSLYAASLSYQKISDTLNEEHIPYSRERPEWNKHKVKRLLENPRYIGRDGYPAIVDDEMFQTVQAMIQEKTAGYGPQAGPSSPSAEGLYALRPMWRNTAPAGWEGPQGGYAVSQMCPLRRYGHHCGRRAAG